MFRIIIALIVILILLYFITRPASPVKERAHVHVEKKCGSGSGEDDRDKKDLSPEINKFFKMPTQCVPIDYPTKKIGECPYSKPPSKDIPVANAPMCFAEKNDNMYLRNTG